MIMPIFTYCGYISLGWSESRKRMIRSIEAQSLAIISPKCSPQNCDLRILTIDNVLQKRACCFVFDCLYGTACFPFKGYFQWSHHNALTTRNNGKSVKLPRVKINFVMADAEIDPNKLVSWKDVLGFEKPQGFEEITISIYK